MTIPLPGFQAHTGTTTSRFPGPHRNNNRAVNAGLQISIQKTEHEQKKKYIVHTSSSGRSRIDGYTTVTSVSAWTILVLHAALASVRALRRRHDPDVADFEIGATTTRTREHPLEPGGKACALKRLQDVLVCGGPVCVDGCMN